MALKAQLPIRLDPDVDCRLQRAAEQAGTSKSAIIRLLAKTFVDQCISEGKVVLPPDWADLLPARDARSGPDQSISIGGNVTGGKITQKKKSTSTSSARGRKDAGKKNK